MNYKKYENILNIVVNKAPIESGVQTLVYMFLYDFVENSDYDLVIIDRLSKRSGYTSYTGISDIAIVRKDSDYQYIKTSDIVMCIEVKNTSEGLDKYSEQIEGQLLTYGKAIITNGYSWKYYDLVNQKPKIKNISNIKELVNQVIKKEIELAKLRIKRNKKTEDEEKLSQIEIEINEKRKEIKDKLQKNTENTDILDKCEKWRVELQNKNNEINWQKYLELIHKITGVITEFKNENI